MTDLSGLELASFIFGGVGLLFAAFGILAKRKRDRITRELDDYYRRRDEAQRPVG